MLSWLANATLTMMFTMIAHGWTTTSNRDLKDVAFEGLGGAGDANLPLWATFSPPLAAVQPGVRRRSSTQWLPAGVGSAGSQGRAEC